MPTTLSELYRAWRAVIARHSGDTTFSRAEGLVRGQVCLVSLMLLLKPACVKQVRCCCPPFKLRVQTNQADAVQHPGFLSAPTR